MPSGPPTASIIVPAYREAANIRPLTERVFTSVRAAGIEAELIIVDDDSNDGTQEIIDALQAQFPVRLVVRRGERGLSGAVLRGFAEARFDRFVVLDADLQHPPERIPDLLRRLDEGDCDFVLGSRYTHGGGIGARWPLGRRLASRLATLLAWPLVSVRDPMSGFFALRRELWSRADRIEAIGYKIALELMVKGRCRRPAEVPIQFAERAAGESKAGLRELVRYLRHLTRLYWFRFQWPLVGAAVLVIACIVTFVAIR